MEQIELVIKIPEEIYDEILNGIENAEIAGVGLGDLSIALKNATPLPKGHGALKDEKDLITKVELNYRNSPKPIYVEAVKIYDSYNSSRNQGRQGRSRGMTKEYAIQILREMIPKFARCDTDVKRLNAINMAIKALSEERKTDWIPVTERLPEWGEDVLVTSGTTVLFAWRSNVDGMWQCAGIDDGLVVTAWMPLPKRYGGSAEE